MKKRFMAVLLLAVLLLASCAKQEVPATLPTETMNPGAEEISAPDGVSGEAVQQLMAHTAIFFPEHDTAYIRGNACQLPVAPFLENGVLYIPAAPVAAVFGGSFVTAEDFYYMNYMGNVSVMMEEYNVLLFNTDAIIMEKTPVVKDGVLCLPFSGLSKALSMTADKSVSQQVFLLGSEGVSEELFAALRQTLLGDTRPYAPVPELQTMAERCDTEAAVLETAAKQKALWTSDGQGTICNVWLDDTGSLCRQRYEMSATYPPEQVFVSQGNTLVSLTDGTQWDTLPDEQYQRQLRQATGRYMELLAAQCVLQDGQAALLLEGYRSAVEGDLKNPVYMQDQNTPYETGIYTAASGEAAWNALVQAARPGDFLVFSASAAGPKYGYFNHSALILETDAQSGMLRLLHARSKENGVGADQEMDYLTFSGFADIAYYRNYDTVFLCRAGDLSQAQAKDMAWNAYEKFNNYQFGYGGRLGLEETNCAELITDAYHAAGVEILDSDDSSRLKEVLKGNTKNLVPIPDDLLLSGNVKVVAVWKQ